MQETFLPISGTFGKYPKMEVIRQARLAIVLFNKEYEEDEEEEEEEEERRDGGGNWLDKSANAERARERERANKVDLATKR
ncbi:hypothetical protein T4C_3058 [Trichinella pseudospiralis]|uniref:Uncharacterized protein n=1 Tax=Trichinella pseudospiralis TaxID=6337 RepID=A0A0V1JVL6_TRIPS|nr:hypothetical protein T4C_3058 [Trichinella pseudospiralis]